MSDYKNAVDDLSLAEMRTLEDRQRALDLFSTHTNLNMAIGLLQRSVDQDDFEHIDTTMDTLMILVERHRRGHNPGSSPPRKALSGTVESGTIDEPVHIETERFHLWLIPGEGTQVQVETEAR